jgi:hypothetical protein
MKNTTFTIVAGIVLAGLLSPGRNVAQQDYCTLQLVYHSDTRGYYRPCG